MPGIVLNKRRNERTHGSPGSGQCRLRAIFAHCSSLTAEGGEGRMHSNSRTICLIEQNGKQNLHILFDG